ncbi:hypothetical protein [Hymenobacter jeollabukensis]|uniref:Uncharacterized protein n=1 Tax=Hymenobacter jeollabukensis TaxID=2025313 RepID=A0A5R8WP21_9BACT|nr:hypothetical protein [Hymenobacter jeollabukensis]TLM91193.1 hypothetical protein FDY95_16500 [Hymenobacter jeollabukensis]
MPRPAPSTGFLYWLAALASAVALGLGVVNGATWSRLVIFAALVVIFWVLGRFPATPGRPRWATLLAGALMLLTLGLLVLRLTGQMV